MSSTPSDRETHPLSLKLQRFKRPAKGPSGDSSDHEPRSIFKLGRNCQVIARAERAAFLVDADAFFRAFTEAAISAQQQIFIVGWDTDSRTELPAPELSLPGLDPAKPLRLADLLTTLVAARPELRVYVLSWDFAFIYLFERESLPSVKFSALEAEERLRFVLDREHPTLASHHQKIVVIDDSIAFSGGLDLTQRRWDTPEHRGHDDRRVDPGGHCYGPFHDVQICVQGEIAKSLGHLVRERWEIATGEKIAPPVLETKDPWPVSAKVDAENVDVALSRTLPFGYGRGASSASGLEKPVLEVERLFLDAIRSARRFLYIENQYFTSPVLAKAIAMRLKEENGPEFVMVLPRDQTGWIEESTMGLLRSEALKIVEDADQFGRFRCYYPVVPGLEDGYVKVHSKVMIVDDVFVRIGSANMNSRSMGLDTECDLSFEARGRSEVKAAIGQLRCSLLCEHLDADRSEFEAHFDSTESLVETVEFFRRGERTLVEIHPNVPRWLKRIAPPKDWIDPSAPRGIRRWIGKRIQRHRHPIAAALIVTITCGFALLQALEMRGNLPPNWKEIASPAELAGSLWNWTRSWDADKIASTLQNFRGQSWSIPLILAGFVFGSLVLVPITAMILGVAFTYPPYLAAPIAGAGAMLSATVLYGIGRYWAWSKSRILSRPWVKLLAKQLNRGGVWAMTAVRLAPIAPFAAVGIVSGGLRIPLRTYLIGTLIGLSPGIIALTLISGGALANGGGHAWMGLLWVLIALSVFSFLMPRLIQRMKGKP